MQKHVLFAIFIAFFAMASGPTASDAIELRVMTYNIKAGFGGHGEKLEPEVGLEKVAKVIEQQSPDVVFLQEVDRHMKRSKYIDEMDWLKNRLAFEAAAYAPALQDGTSFYGIGMLFKKATRAGGGKHNLYKPDYRETRPDYPDYFAEQRVLLHTTAIIEGTTVDLFCTHLGLTPDQRERQIAQIAEIAGTCKNPVIVGGDFNAAYESKEMKPLREALHSPFEILKVPKEGRFSHPNGPKPSHAIDGFFVSDGIRVKDVKVILDNTAASDHNPVVTVLEVAAKAGN